MERNEVYFVADVHLGLRMGDPEARERNFVDFLKSIPVERTSALYLLGDIWDFWYEYRDVVPRCGIRVVAEFIRLMDSGVQIWFCRGNHDIWTFNFFQQLGMHKFSQPYRVEIGGKTFCMGHGDLLGGSKPGYRFMVSVFSCRFFQRLYSMLHPRQAFDISNFFSYNNRRSRPPYRFRGEDEPLYHFAVEEEKRGRVDYFVFGHYHDHVDMTTPGGARFCVLKDWIGGGQPYAVFNGTSFSLHSLECPE